MYHREYCFETPELNWQLKDGWREFFESVESKFNLEIWAHFTFKEDVSEEEAIRELNILIHRMNRRVYGRNYKNKGLGIAALIAMEDHVNKRSKHFHVIFGQGSLGVRLKEIRDYWFLRNGKAKIEKYKPALDGVGYITKQAHCGAQLDLLIPEKYKYRLFE